MKGDDSDSTRKVLINKKMDIIAGEALTEREFDKK